MGQDEAEVDIAEDQEEAPGGAAQLSPAKHRVQADRHEEGRPAVQAVVKQFPQGPAAARVPGVLAIYAVCNGGPPVRGTLEAILQNRGMLCAVPYYNLYFLV